MKKHSIFTVLVLLCFISIAPGAEAKTATTTTPTITTQAESEKRVREFFKDTPVMIEIARCESKFRQFTDSGNPLRSAGMIGVFQFYESIHAPGAKALGFDIATLEGNLGYAKHVYATEGTTPWNGSRYCWETATIITPNRAALLQQIDTLTKLIALLQKQLETKRALG